MKVLVTGATGFLGQHIVDEFRSADLASYEVVGVGSKQYNITNATDTERLFQDHKPDIVLHLAARCGGILANKNSPADFLVSNLQMGINIYEMSRKYNVKKVYALGSVCQYPVNCPTPFREDDIWNGAAESTNFPYGQAKRSLMMMSQTYREQYGLGGAFFIPVNMYGEKDHFDLVNSHVVPALINKFVNAVEKNLTTVECWGSGNATRELFFVGDCVEALIKAITSDFDSSLPINLGTGIDISIKDLASLIAKLTGFKGDIVFTGDVSDGQPKRRLDVSRAKAMLGWEAKTKLEDGLIKTIAWYQNNKKES